MEAGRRRLAIRLLPAGLLAAGLLTALAGCTAATPPAEPSRSATPAADTAPPLPGHKPPVPNPPPG
jgi:hypothetical protein